VPSNLFSAFVKYRTDLGIGGFDFEENTLQETGKRDRTDQTDNASNYEQLHSVR